MDLIVIPDGLSSGELKVLPDGLARASMDKLIMGTSNEGKPKVTIKYIITEEMSAKMDSGEPTLGETILETVSLQPQALFTLNGIWKAVTKEGLKESFGDVGLTPEEFSNKLNEVLQGTVWDLMLKAEPSYHNPEVLQTKITKRRFVSK